MDVEECEKFLTSTQGRTTRAKGDREENVKKVLKVGLGLKKRSVGD